MTHPDPPPPGDRRWNRGRVRPSAPPASGGGAHRPLTVSELTDRISRTIDREIGYASVEGEVSDLKVSPHAGHAYFTLKDDAAQLAAVCFRQRFASIRGAIRNGARVEVSGPVRVYAPRGQYQIVVEAAREAGVGERMRRLLELREKLRAEGLFDPARKRPLPAYPRTIGVVSSRAGAAVRDVLQVIRRRAPGAEVLIASCAVQGDAAPAQIVRAIRRLERDGRAEVVLVARGGGAVEDLWAFNDEAVVRAVAACAIPTVAGVGHEIDTTLTDLAADVRAPTPSAAAEMATARYETMFARSEALERAMARDLRRRLDAARSRVEALSGSWGMRRPLDALRTLAQRADELAQRIDRAPARRFAEARRAIRAAAERLERASPGARVRRAKESLARLEERLEAAGARRRQRLGALRGRLDETESRLERAAGRAGEDRRKALAAVAARLATLGPSATLKRGYCIVSTPKGRRVVSSPDQTRVGQQLRVRGAGGSWRVAVVPDREDMFDE